MSAISDYNSAITVPALRKDLVVAQFEISFLDESSRTPVFSSACGDLARITRIAAPARFLSSPEERLRSEWRNLRKMGATKNWNAGHNSKAYDLQLARSVGEQPEAVPGRLILSPCQSRPTFVAKSFLPSRKLRPSVRRPPMSSSISSRLGLMIALKFQAPGFDSDWMLSLAGFPESVMHSRR